ncbi:response regulator [Azotosporobacter soli]|uniref:response regulator n=1 Tax=Azotosporobacter soli TaxID=3055040 RepID=UPI0031FF2132
MTKQTLLIVDDEPGNIKILVELLRAEYNIRIANHGEKALKIVLAEEAPDLVLLDITMPGLDGYEVCRRISGNSRDKIPVILISGKNSEADKEKGFEAGAVDYVIKPFCAEDLKICVQTHIKAAHIDS